MSVVRVFYRIPMTTRVPPTREQLALFLGIVNDPVRQPVYVHCKGGKHRTGVMTAVYRMERQLERRPGVQGNEEVRVRMGFPASGIQALRRHLRAWAFRGRRRAGWSHAKARSVVMQGASRRTRLRQTDPPHFDARRVATCHPRADEPVGGCGQDRIDAGGRENGRLAKCDGALDL
jgi:Tyrosine phosphatase family